MKPYQLRLGLSSKALAERLRFLALSPLFGVAVIVIALVADTTEADRFALYACAFINLSVFLCYYLLLKFYLVLKSYQLVLLFMVHLVNVSLWVLLAAQLFITLFHPESAWASSWIWLVIGIATFDVVQHFLFRVIGSHNNLLMLRLDYRLRDSLGGTFGQLFRKRLLRSRFGRK